MSGFLDIRFPEDISYGSSGGPGYNTSVIQMRSGKESRNANWAYPRCEYDVAYGVKRQNDLEALVEFFHIAQGMAYSFRYKDHMDYKSCRTNQDTHWSDQVIGTGDGSTLQFQIYKSYKVTSVDGGTIFSRSRKITKIVPDTIKVGVDGTQSPDPIWAVDEKTGILSFGIAPNPDEVITCGFEFDVHCRFNTDSISVAIEDYRAGETEIPVIEDKS